MRCLVVGVIISVKLQKLLESRGQRGGPGSNNTLFYLLIVESQKVNFHIYKKKALSTSTFQVNLYRTQILKPDSWKNRPMRREAVDRGILPVPTLGLCTWP